MRRPRLFIGLLTAAIIAGVGIGLVLGTRGGDPDVVLSDPQSVDALTNAQVEGDPLPLVDLYTAAGAPVNAGDLLGQPLVVNFWFAACPPCGKEMPDFAALEQELDGQVRFIGVNAIDSVATMQQFGDSVGVEYDLLVDDLGTMTDAVGVMSFPTTLFVTSDGTIIEQTGFLDAASLRAKVDNLVAVDPGA